ncbi:hypothetical protein F5Y18DRAFT_402776 [Xylariaceae sp. FL1019]|nr:hypothetical protein F5Y18DRAFT_402776 [Xylariaceae sp. FL1019]
MDIAPDCIVVADNPEESYFDHDRCRFSREKVQKFLDRGHMSLDAVLQRYTELLKNKLTHDCESPSMVNDLRMLFQSLRDPVTGYLPSAALKRPITERLSYLQLGPSEETMETLWDIFVSHAFFPFPPAYDSSVLAEIDESSFLRALSLLIVPDNRGIGPKFRRASHGWVSGVWCSHRGNHHCFRGRGAIDYRRVLFRSLATVDRTKSQGNTTTIPVPRFMWLEPYSGGSEEDYEQQQFVVFEDEPEASVDTLDVLSTCTREQYRMMPSPLRDSYYLVLPSLPKHQEDISSLGLSKNKLVALIKLCGEVRNIDSAMLIASVQDATSDAHVDWAGFEKVMSEHTELLADGLSDVFRTLTRP